MTSCFRKLLSLLMPGNRLTHWCFKSYYGICQKQIQPFPLNIKFCWKITSRKTENHVWGQHQFQNLLNKIQRLGVDSYSKHRQTHTHTKREGRKSRGELRRCCGRKRKWELERITVTRSIIMCNTGLVLITTCTDSVKTSTVITSVRFN